MSGYYLNRPLPVFDGKEFVEFERLSDLHFVEQKKCKHWKRVYSEITKSLSHFGDCHNPDNKTTNCGYDLCPIRNGDSYDHGDK
jgi:hypothetical protein